MRLLSTFLIAVLGALTAVVGTSLFQSNATPLKAASTDRYNDYIICTGAVAVNPRATSDGVWMLDYRSGRLLGTGVDRNAGTIGGWSEVDLVKEFGIPPKQDVHFMMTTGMIAQGQAALYVAEVTTGKFGIYSMGPSGEGAGIVIRRHDMTSFRSNKAEAPAVFEK